MAQRAFSDVRRNFGLKSVEKVCVFGLKSVFLHIKIGLKSVKNYIKYLNICCIEKLNPLYLNIFHHVRIRYW